MTEFDKLNLMVVPIQDPVKFHKLPNYNGVPVKWSDPSTYCSWEEREDVYPGVKEWYIIPAARCKYRSPEGVDVSYYVIDVDNHEGDKFEEACKFLRSCNLPKSLTVRTPSGGIHKYYKCLSDYIPKAVNGVTINGVKLPIEIKSSVGVVAPNGRDRIIIDDSPVAMLMPDSNMLFSQLVHIKDNGPHLPRKETDPNFPIEEEPFPDSIPGDRHNTLMATACSLYARGCPPDKIQWWGEEFYRRTNRKEQPNEVSNIVRDAVRYVDDDEAVNEQLLVELKQEAEEDEAKQKTFEDIFPGAEELTGWEAVKAKALFSDRDETKQYIKDELKNLPPEDLPFARGMLNPNKIRTTWAQAPQQTQEKYEDFKDSLKILMEKP